MKKFSVTAVLVVFFVGSFMASRTFAVPEVNVITSNCVAAQSVLNKIQKADTGSRINRGHDYSEILDLMFTMNARLSVNKIAAPTLTDLAQKFEQNLAKYRSNYSNYDDAITDALEVKCISKPLDFYSKLELSRTAREALKEDITILRQNIDDYYAEFDTVIKGVI